jgi:hypothetical protein
MSGITGPLKGTRVRLMSLSPEATAEDIRRMVRQRTGLDLPMDRIVLDSPKESVQDIGATLIIGFEELLSILEWAFHEDIILGRNVHFAIDKLKWSGEVNRLDVTAPSEGWPPSGCKVFHAEGSQSGE